MPQPYCQLPECSYTNTGSPCQRGTVPCTWVWWQNSIKISSLRIISFIREICSGWMIHAPKQATSPTCPNEIHGPLCSFYTLQPFQYHPSQPYSQSPHPHAPCTWFGCWHSESLAGILPRNLCLPGEHLSVPELEQQGEHNPGFLECFWPPSTCSCEKTGLNSLILLQGTTFGDQREAAVRMGKGLVKHSGLQAGISLSCLSTASSARGLNSRKYGLRRAKSCFLKRKGTAAEYLGQQMSTGLH